MNEVPHDPATATSRQTTMPPPGKESGTHVEALTTCTLSVAAGTDDDANVEDSAAYRQWRAELVADTEAAMEELAQDTLRSLSTEQVDGLRWIGLMDQGWSRMYRDLTP